MKGFTRQIPQDNVTLACFHCATYDPAPYLHDIVYCAECREYQVVVGGSFLSGKAVTALDQDWRFRAICRQCKYRKYRTEKHACFVGAQNHAERAAHTVDVLTKAGTYLGSRSRNVTNL